MSIVCLCPMSTGTGGWRAPRPGKSQGTVSDTICIFSSVFFQLKSALYFVFIYLLHLFILLLAILGPCCCTPVFSSCKARASHYSDFPCCWAWALGIQSPVVMACGFSHTMLNPLRWGIKPMSPALQGGFPAVGLPGQSCSVFYFIIFYFILFFAPYFILLILLKSQIYILMEISKVWPWRLCPWRNHNSGLAWAVFLKRVWGAPASGRLGEDANMAIPAPEPFSESPQMIRMQTKPEPLKVPSLKASSSLLLAFGLPICLHPEAPSPPGPTSARVSLFQDIPSPGQAEGFLNHWDCTACW